MESDVAMTMNVPPITVVQAAAVGAVVAPLFLLQIGVARIIKFFLMIRSFSTN